MLGAEKQCLLPIQQVPVSDSFGNMHGSPVLKVSYEIKGRRYLRCIYVSFSAIRLDVDGDEITNILAAFSASVIGFSYKTSHIFITFA